MPREVVGRVHGREEREGSLLGVAVALVVDVVEHEAIEGERAEPVQCDVGDLLGPLRRGRLPGRGDREEQELAVAFRDATPKIHDDNRTGEQ